MKYIASWSGGKDSTASIILAHEHNELLDLIIFSEVMFDENISRRLRSLSGCWKGVNYDEFSWHCYIHSALYMRFAFTKIHRIIVRLQKD